MITDTTMVNLLSEKVADEAVASANVGSKRGKKRSRGYEGDEVFGVGRGILCETDEDTEHLLAALEGLLSLFSHYKLQI